MDAAHEFTEDGYRELVAIARARYAFRLFPESATMTSGVLWRHDIDMSPHRAVALAKIEAEQQVQSTYFVYLHCTFYNALELSIVRRLRQLADLGHAIGLHFDPGFYGLTPDNRAELDRLVTAERELLERTVGVPVSAMSFHDPDLNGFVSVADDTIAGLVNVYGQRLKNGFGYCSDSNGYWRFAPLRDVLTTGGHERLHVLTHPEWWVPEPMTPRERVARAMDGRRASEVRRYDEGMRAAGRK